MAPKHLQNLKMFHPKIITRQGLKLITHCRVDTTERHQTENSHQHLQDQKLFNKGARCDPSPQPPFSKLRYNRSEILPISQSFYQHSES